MVKLGNEPKEELDCIGWSTMATDYKVVGQLKGIPGSQDNYLTDGYVTFNENDYRLIF